MKKQVNTNQVGEDAMTDESKPNRYGDFMTYWRLKEIKSSDKEIQEHMHMTAEEIESLVEEFDPKVVIENDLLDEDE